MIFLFLLTSGVSVYFLAIESQTSMVETQEIINTLQTRKTQENFDVSISTDIENNNRLAIQIKNQGHFPLEIADFWIINKTDANNEFPATRHEINFTEPFIPPGYGANILENHPLYMNPDTYNVKVVSTLGTIHQKELIVGPANNLRAELFAIPADVKVGQNATIALHVTNVGDSRLLDVLPNNMTITPTSGVTLPLPPIPNPVTLDPAESTIFSWNYQVAGTVGNNVSFMTNVTATEDITGFNVTSNNALDAITLREPDAEELIVLTQDLISRPEIFMIIPSPFGNGESAPGDPEKGLWGVNIVNPTEQEMFVNKVTISLLSPRASTSDKMFNAGTGLCNPETVSPTPMAWTCPGNNQLMWKDAVNPQRIPPLSSFPFLVMMDPGSLSQSSVDLETMIVHTNVFTTVGEFGKSGYGSSMVNNPGSSIVNVFLASDTQSTDKDSILANVTGIPSGSTITFNATLADFEKTNSPTSRVDETSRLLINIPKDWTNPTLISWTGYENTPTIQNFSDNSHQIIGDLSSDLTGDDDNGRTIQFNVTAPTVSSTQMYVMYLLADGKVEAAGEPDFTIGPLSEIILQVLPP